jgi:hypothetical protein
MDLSRFTRVDETTWRIDPHGAMRVPAIIYADEKLIRDMDDRVYDQAVNVAMLPGIVQASYAMPDAHWGYGFPIGGVAGFDAEQGGVVSAGGVGFDISCGVRTMLTGLKVPEILPVQQSLADSLYRQIPAGVGSTGAITLDTVEMDAMLSGGARWAVDRGWGEAPDLSRIEENGTRPAPCPRMFRNAHVSGSALRWARWAQATITWKCRRLPRFSTRMWRNVTASPRTMSWSLFIAAHAASDIKSERNICATWCPLRRRPALGFPIGSLHAPQSNRNSANAISALCGPPSIARSPTAKFSDTLHGGSLHTSSQDGL